MQSQIVTLYVAYEIQPAKRSGPEMLFSDQGMLRQQKRITEFLSDHPNSKLIRTFQESNPQKARHDWPALSQAVDYCLEHHAHLIIAEIRNLTHNEAFTREIFRLLESNLQSAKAGFELQLICCDQPFIDRQNFSVLVEHARKQKEIHGQLIKAGLKRSTARSGNPHASDVITKVNKPKVDNAILFALILQPIINDYQARGLSQRQMVQSLNEEGFLAPEGGQWVLSQLQKVLDRIKINESALTLEKQLLEYKARSMSQAAIAEHLNSLGVPAPKGHVWNDELVEIVSERIKQLHDIIRFNEFVIELMPILSKYHVDELTEELFLEEMKASGIKLPSHLALVEHQREA